MASKIFISDTSHGDYSSPGMTSSPLIPPDDRPLFSKSVAIGNNVWIGENVCILLGVKIGDGCVIGANSVVINNVPENCIVAGSPAIVKKQWSDELGMWINTNNHKC
jgi:acetyltransferase-like isoleucine patch superfamily enzyme